MSTPDEPPPIPRDLAEDEPDLYTDAELEAITPPLPPLDDDPMPPLAPVAPGPEEASSIAGAPTAGTSLDDMVEKVEEGRFPEEDQRP